MSDAKEDIPGDETTTLVTVTTVNTAAEALVIQSYLKSEGVWAEVPTYHFYSQMPWMGLSVGGFQVNVRRSDAPKALELIGGVDKNWSLTDCPECGSADVVIGQAVLRNAASFLGGGLFAPPYIGKRRCRACGHGWTAHKPKLIHGIGIAILLLMSLTAFGVAYWKVPFWGMGP